MPTYPLRLATSTVLTPAITRRLAARYGATLIPRHFALAHWVSGTFLGAYLARAYPLELPLWLYAYSPFQPCEHKPPCI